MDEKPLVVTSTDLIAEALLKLVSRFPSLPFKATSKSVQWNNLDEEEGIGIIPSQGAIYLKRYTRGAYVGQMPVRLAYRDNPTNNKGRINCQKILEDLGRFLENSTRTIQEGIEVQRIERTSPVYISEADENGTVVYMSTLNVTYYSQK